MVLKDNMRLLNQKNFHSNCPPQFQIQVLCPRAVFVTYIAVIMTAMYLSGVSGYPTGPPIASHRALCSDMTPSGHPGSPSTASPPYAVSFNQSQYTPGQPLEGEFNKSVRIWFLCSFWFGFWECSVLPET